MEEKEHIIKALQTKVTLLKSRAESESEDPSSAATTAPSENGDETPAGQEESNLIDLDAGASNGGDVKALPATSGGKKDSAKVKEMEGKKPYQKLGERC